MTFRYWFAFFLISSLFLPVLLMAQNEHDEEEDDFPPGLAARYSSAGHSIERVDDDISFVWDENAPDSRLPDGMFTAEWAGQLLNRQAIDYRFHAYVVGEVRVEIDGKTVLSGRANQAGWISGDLVPLDFGEKDLRVTFRKTEKNARIGLYWSSSTFPLEPVPAFLLFRETGNPTVARIASGETLFDTHRCNRCHRRENESESVAAPALTNVAGTLDPRWLVRQIENPSSVTRHSKMPSFGFSTDEASAVAAFLWANSKRVELESLPAVEISQSDGNDDDDDADADADADASLKLLQQQGEILFHSVGCLACHRTGKNGNDGPYSGGDLSAIADKRSEAWLFTWLGDPTKLNRDHRMPVIKLEPNERRLLAIYLQSLGSQKTSSRDETISRDAADAEIVARGKKLVEASRCAACHHIEGIAADLAGIPDLSTGFAKSNRSCLTKEVDRTTHLPTYANIDHVAVTSFLNSRTGPLSKQSKFAQGALLLRRRGCTECHERNLAKGLVKTAGRISRTYKELKGQSEALIPPMLTAVGDKLLDEALDEAVSGEQKSVRLPWLHVRMPRFAHTSEEKDALLKYLIGHDRIPTGAPRQTATGKSTVEKSNHALTDAQTLIGPKGFVCTSCHIVGSFQPRNVALGTRGSNLLMLGKRMRPSYFLRWTRSPLRIVPGMEMPSYTRPIPGLLGGSVKKQLAATWDVLNDPDFVAPTNPSIVEQSLVVLPGERPRIVRDVFTNPKENGGGYIARGMAIGLNNGHNLLFDLGRMAVRGWSVGDFAQQRTVGKSWYWELSGTRVVSKFGNGADISLRRKNKKDAKLLHPHIEQDTTGRLISYRETIVDGDAAVEIHYRLAFDVDGTRQSMSVRELIRPLVDNSNDNTTSWERRITIETLADEFDVLIARPKLEGTAHAVSITTSNSELNKWNSIGENTDREYTSFPNSTRKGKPTPSRLITLHYRCSLKREAPLPTPSVADEKVNIERVTSLPGYEGLRLPLDEKIMPTAMTWTPNGTLAFTSLNGHVYLAHDSDGDGLEDKLTLFEEGLTSPFGIVADGDDLIVSHKPELLRLRDTNGDGRADVRIVVATGWGHSDNYHDWTTGIVRDSKNNLYVGLGSDYAQKERPKQKARWRGKVLRIDPSGKITPIGHSFRYPIGLAIDAQDRIFVSDNQGVQNTFNEINFLQAGNHYGVPSRHEQSKNIKPVPPAIQLPHPWTRSVNGLFFLKNQPDSSPLAGHGIGCEYDSKFLIRFTTEEVEGIVQGAAYYFSIPNSGSGSDNFLGPLCGAVAPNGDIYIGSIHDSGWQGGRNTGEIVRLKKNGPLPNGIRELRSMPDGFEIEFFGPADKTAAARVDNYNISGYTRVWKGGYATPDSGRHTIAVQSAHVSAGATTVRLHLRGLREGHVYEVSCRRISADGTGSLWPSTGHYTLHRIGSASAAPLFEKSNRAKSRSHDKTNLLKKKERQRNGKS